MRHIVKVVSYKWHRTPLESHLNQQQTTCDSRTQVATNCAGEYERREMKKKFSYPKEARTKLKMEKSKVRDDDFETAHKIKPGTKSVWTFVK